MRATGLAMQFRPGVAAAATNVSRARKQPSTPCSYRPRSTCGCPRVQGDIVMAENVIFDHPYGERSSRSVRRPQELSTPANVTRQEPQSGGGDDRRGASHVGPSLASTSDTCRNCIVSNKNIYSLLESGFARIVFECGRQATDCDYGTCNILACVRQAIRNSLTITQSRVPKI